jgi:hypothetical protein
MSTTRGAARVAGVLFLRTEIAAIAGTPMMALPAFAPVAPRPQLAPA